MINSKPFHLLIGLIMGFSFFLIILSWNHPLSLMGFLMSPVYRYTSNYEINNSEVNRIAEFCKPFKYEDEVKCVLSQIGYYKFNDSYKVYVRTPEESLMEGMVCRDFAVFASSVFERLGFRTEFRFLPQHVYLSIYQDDPWFWCDINNGEYHCWE